MKTNKKYPATMLVHWSTGPIACCTKHGNALMGLGSMLGTHVPATKLMESAECENCKNEAKLK